MKKSTSNAVVLLADHPIPSGGKGSWSQRIEYLLQHFLHNKVDYLICNDSPHPFESAFTRRFSCRQYPSKWLNAIFPFIRYREYFSTIDKLFREHDKLVLCVLDSQRVKHAIWHYINRKKLAARVTIVYYHCGFAKFLTASQHEKFTEGIKHCIYLTEGAYRYELQHNPSLPFAVSILPNPIDAAKFFPLSSAEKMKRKTELNWSTEKIHYLWVSYDRPKKGLDIILQAWEKFFEEHTDGQLHIVGASRPMEYKGVTFYGQVPNWDVHQFLMAADVGIFSPLWNEGFSLALAQMISCGMPVLASNVGCVPDFFVPGKHGIAIETPNIPQAWANALLMQKESWKGINAGDDISNMDHPDVPAFLTYDAWCSQFCEILSTV